MRKYIIVRFSSFGDIAQALPCARVIRAADPHAEVHLATRLDFADFAKSHSAVDRVWALKREDGLGGLGTLARQLHKEGYTHIYDAHNNLRSHLLCLWLWIMDPSRKILRRPKNRFKRWLLFRLGINKFPSPFRGMKSYLEPLRKWFPNVETPLPEDLETKTDRQKLSNWPLGNCIALAPSANWELKRWPIDHWKQLVKLLTQNSQIQIVLLGGRDDEFCEDIRSIAPDRTHNLAGLMSWTESTEVIKQVRGVVSGDTGILHVADLMGRSTVGLIGPTAFGFPSQPTSQVMEVELKCRPCSKDGRGQCRNSIYKRCMIEITPQAVFDRIKPWL